jgi:hypothetical protein
LALGFLASGFGAFVFLMWEAFGREKNCWRRIAKGELLSSLKAETLRKLKREHRTVQVCTENFIHML